MRVARVRRASDAWNVARLTLEEVRRHVDPRVLAGLDEKTIHQVIAQVEDRAESLGGGVQPVILARQIQAEIMKLRSVR